MQSKILSSTCDGLVEPVFGAYHDLQLTDLHLLLVDLLVLHLQHLLQALQVLLDVLVGSQRLLLPRRPHKHTAASAPVRVNAPRRRVN